MSHVIKYAVDEMNHSCLPSGPRSLLCCRPAVGPWIAHAVSTLAQVMRKDVEVESDLTVPSSSFL